MNYRLLSRIFIALFMGVSMAITLSERTRANLEGSRKCFIPVLNVDILPVVMFVAAAEIFFIERNARLSALKTFGMGITSVMIVINVYYLLLCLVIPYIRKEFQPEASAVLWNIPNILAITLYAFYYGMRRRYPDYIIRIPMISSDIFMIIWAAGFAVSMIKSIANHIIFRRRLLKDAVLAEDEELLSIFGSSKSEIKLRKKGPGLMISKSGAGPVTVGLFRWTARVVIPDEDYTKEELSMIFRHELIHFKHRDSNSKFFIAFCKALCWFNPFVYRSGEYCSQDLELSCDEKVVMYSSPDQKKKYAELVLDSSAPAGGFTTCLSAKVEGLKYRLESILYGSKKKSGAILVCIATTFLILFGDNIALAFDAAGYEAAFGSVKEDGINELRYYEDDYEGVKTWDEEGAAKWLATLDPLEITGFYNELGADHELYLSSGKDENEFGIIVRGRWLRIIDYEADGSYTYQNFYLSEEPDWESLKQFITEEEPYPESPVLLMSSEVIGKDLRIGPIVRLMTYGSETIVPGYPQEEISCTSMGCDESVITVEPAAHEGELKLWITPYFEGDFEEYELPFTKEIGLPEQSCAIHIRGNFPSTRNTVYDCEYVMAFIRPDDEGRYEEKMK